MFFISFAATKKMNIALIVVAFVAAGLTGCSGEEPASNSSSAAVADQQLPLNESNSNAAGPLRVMVVDASGNIVYNQPVQASAAGVINVNLNYAVSKGAVVVRDANPNSLIPNINKVKPSCGIDDPCSSGGNPEGGQDGLGDP